MGTILKTKSQRMTTDVSKYLLKVFEFSKSEFFGIDYNKQS